MSRLKKILLGIAAFFMLLAALIWWLLSTDSGTRFLFARVSSYLPPALSIEDVSGSLRGGLVANNVRWSDPAADVSIRTLAIDISLRELINERIAIESLDLDTVEVVTRAVEQDEPEESAPVDISLPVGIWLQQASIRNLRLDINGVERIIEQIELQATIKDSDLNLSRFSLDSTWLDVAGRGSIRLKDSLPLRAVINWQYHDVPDWPLAGKLELGGTVTDFSIDHSLTQPFAIESSGDVTLADGSVQLAIDNSWALIELDEYAVVSRDGTLRIEGTPEQFDASLDALVEYAGVPEARVDLQSRLTPTSAESLTLSAENSWGRATVEGNAGWSETVRFDVTYALDDVNAASLYSEISGLLASNGRVTGEIGDSSRTLAVTIASLSGELNDYPVSASAALGVNDAVYTLSDLQATVGPNELVASGRFADSARLDVDLTASRLDAFLPDLGGSATAMIALTGRADDPVVDLTVVTTDLTWQETRIDELSIAANGSRDDHTIRIRGTAANTNLNVGARGKVVEQGWTGTIGTLELEHPQAGMWSLDTPSRLAFRDATVSLGQLCLRREAGPGSACASVSTTEDIQFSATVDDLPLAALPLVLPREITAEGRIFIASDGRIANGVVTASASADVRDARVTTQLEGESWVTTFDAVTATAAIQQNALEAEARIGTAEGGLSLTLNADDILQPASPINGVARLELPDFSRLAGLVPAVANPAGSASGELQIAGTRQAPAVTGQIEISDGSFGVRVAGIRVEDLNARVSQLEPGSLAVRASATSGDGPINFEGNTRLLEDGGLESTFTLTGDRFELIRTPDWQAVASPDVDISVTDKATTVTGMLEIPDASVKLKDLPASAVRSSPDAVVHRPGAESSAAAQRPINIDVRAVLGDGVGLSAFGLTTNLSGSLQLRGDANQVINGFGRVSLVEGRYKAYGQNLSIQRGELIFNGPLSRPQLDVRAVREVPGVTAGIMVRGTPDALQSEVFSDPPLRDIEALSYLLTGRPLGQESGDGDFLGEAAFALGLTGAGKIASRVRSNLGLDTLTIQGGSENGTIVAGKRLNDRLLVEYGYGIVDRLGSLLLRYQLNERLVLESRTGLNSNLDLVYRVRKK